MTSKTNSDDIDTILEKWYEGKEKIAMLQKRMESYKKYIERRMNKSGQNQIRTSKYFAMREIRSRSYISKKSIPKELWDKYSHKCEYYTYSLKKA